MGVFEMVVVVVAVSGLISILHKWVEMTGKSRSARMELYQRYLDPILDDVREIKRRLQELERQR